MIFLILLKVYPLIGPQKTFSKINIIGCGFYKNTDIIIKFSNNSINQTHIAPRSCLAELMSSTNIVCKPPKFASLGEYNLSVCLDGSDYLIDTMNIVTYREFMIVDMLPHFYDLRNLNSNNELFSFQIVSIY